MAESCESCRFWFRTSNTALKPMGMCRRYPPHANIMAMPTAPSAFTRGAVPTVQIQTVTVWPETEPTRWCGEWKLMVLKEVTVDEPSTTNVDTN
jgi:hypothetical protein